MSLDPKFQRAVGQYMREKCPNYRCPACAEKNWGTGEIVVLNSIPDGQDESHPELLRVPCLPIICMNCGFVALFSSGVMGIDPPRT